MLNAARVAARENSNGLSYDQWVEAILFGGVSREDLPTERWLRPQWRGGADPADIVVELLRDLERKRGPRTGPQTIESFRGALVRALGRPDSSIKFVRGVGLRWEVLPDTGVFVNVNIERDRRGIALAKVDGVQEPFASPDAALGAIDARKKALTALAKRHQLAAAINGVAEKQGSDPAEKVVDTLQSLFAKYDVPARFSVSMGDYIYVTAPNVAGRERQVTLYRRKGGLFTRGHWQTYGDVWPGKILAGLKEER